MEKNNSEIVMINSEIDSDADVQPFSHIINSRILGTSKVYKGCWIVNSLMKENTFSGEWSKLDNSSLNIYSRVGKNNHLYHAELGKHSYTGQDTVIMHTSIGAFTSISWGVTIGAGEHDFNRITSHSFLYNTYDALNNGEISYNRFEKECQIGNDVWIGANATILRGVTIGDGAVIGANSIVTKSVPPYAVVAGNPSKIIKYRFEEEIVQRFLSIKWWDFTDEMIRGNSELFSRTPSHETLCNLEMLAKLKRGEQE